MIRAIADAQVKEAETVLLALQGAADPNMQKEVLYALSCVGGSNSLPVLAKAAENAGYTMEITGANEAYIALLKRLVESDRAAAMKAAKNYRKKPLRPDRSKHGKLLCRYF